MHNYNFMCMMYHSGLIGHELELGQGISLSISLSLNLQKKKNNPIFIITSIILSASA